MRLVGRAVRLMERGNLSRHNKCDRSCRVHATAAAEGAARVRNTHTRTHARLLNEHTQVNECRTGGASASSSRSSTRNAYTSIFVQHTTIHAHARVLIHSIAHSVRACVHRWCSSSSLIIVSTFGSTHFHRNYTTNKHCPIGVRPHIHMHATTISDRSINYCNIDRTSHCLVGRRRRLIRKSTASRLFWLHRSRNAFFCCVCRIWKRHRRRRGLVKSRVLRRCQIGRLCGESWYFGCKIEQE